MINGLTTEEYHQFYWELWFCSCTREAMENLHRKWFPFSNQTHYPDEYYADKDKWMMGMPSGHLRCLVTQGGKMIWIKDSPS